MTGYLVNGRPLARSLVGWLNDALGWVWGIFYLLRLLGIGRDQGTAMALRGELRRRDRNEEALAHGQALLSGGVSNWISPSDLFCGESM